MTDDQKYNIFSHSCKCPYCNMDAYSYISATDIHLKLTNEIFRLYSCSHCGLKFINNPPQDLTPFYPVSYRLHPKIESDLNQLMAQQKYKLDLLLQFKSSGRILEIGSSNGAFCLLAKRAGFNVTALELDNDSVRFLNDVVGLNAIQTDDPAALLEADDSKYDAICLWHSIEHMSAPWALLKFAAERLNHGGVLVVAAPNADAWQAQVLKSNWIHHDMPRHLFALSPDWMRRVLGQAGLQEKLCTFSDEGSKAYTRLTWIFYFQSLTEKSLSRRILGRVGSVVGRLLNPFESMTSNSAGYTMIFSRP